MQVKGMITKKIKNKVTMKSVNKIMAFTIAAILVGAIFLPTSIFC